MCQSIVQRACAKLRSTIGDESVVRLSFAGDLREILDALEAIQPFLEDAEARPLRDSSALTWLCDVRAAAYNIMDMVDELQDTRSPAAATMTRMLPRLAIMKSAMATKVDETKKRVMAIQERCSRFDSMEVDAIFRQITQGRITGPVFEEALVVGMGPDKERIKAMLLSAARNIAQEPTIILPIFGLAGSGKTTLAQMVFNDTRFLHCYDFRVWVHVSPEFDFHRIGESIVSQVSQGGGGGGQKDGGMEYIMNYLHKLFNDKKVLVVLDDVWEDDSIQLQLLKSMLTFLGDMVDVIVTTCNQAIARKICTIEPYKISHFSDDTCWKIIKKSICFEEEEPSEKIGREIASKCFGLPSLAREFARMLCSIGAKRWDLITRKDILDEIFHSCYVLALPTLELSYTSMPSNLKLCFAYCAIFPKGHIIVKDDLIHQWIALRLIEPSDTLSTTQMAEECITKLLDMSILQTANMDNVGGKDGKGVILFTMPGLVHTLARQCAQNETVIVVGNRRSAMRSAHYKLLTNWAGDLMHEFDENVRALRCVDCSKMELKDDSFSYTRYLRVLELKDSSMQKLPDSICQLRHLRYLNISEFVGLLNLPKSFGHLINLFHVKLLGCSGLVNLPESFGKLIHLVHINLSDCSGLVTLPVSFGKLINVRHMNLSGCSRLLSLPESFGKLVNLVRINLSGCSALATLPESFGDLMSLSHIDISRCHRLSEIPQSLQKLDKLVHLDLSFWSCFGGIGKGLGGLTNLQHLNLSHPCCNLAQHRSDLQGLKHGLCNLTSLRYLNLSMCLNPIFYYHKSQEDNLRYIGDCLRGLSTLEHLDLSHNTFLSNVPESLGNLTMLHTLDLSGCIRLKRVDEMKSLKFVALRNCRGLKSCNFVVCVDDDDAAYSSSSSNNSNIVQLEDIDCHELHISCLEKVSSYEEACRIRLMEKQKLEKLKLSWTMGSHRSVEDNVLLGELVPPRTLQCLELNGYGGTCLPEYLRDLTSLRELKIFCCKHLNSLPDSIQELTNLKDLCISDCPKLEKWCRQEENKKMFTHVPNQNYEEHGSATATRQFSLKEWITESS